MSSNHSNFTESFDSLALETFHTNQSAFNHRFNILAYSVRRSLQSEEYYDFLFDPHCEFLDQFISFCSILPKHQCTDDPQVALLKEDCIA